jgi:hypothetical protein
MESWTLIELESPTIQFNHAAHGGLTGIAELGSDPVYSFIRSPWACPRVQQLNAARFEISCVASRHCCCIGARDGCNLTIELTDRAAGSAALGGDGCIGFGGCAVKWQDTAAEIFIQDAFYSFGERSAASPRSELRRLRHGLTRRQRQINPVSWRYTRTDCGGEVAWRRAHRRDPAQYVSRLFFH